MKSTPLTLVVRVLVLCLLVGCVVPSFAGSGSSGQTPATSTAASPKQTTPKTAGSVPSAADIAAAKATGKVWVNLNTGVYHRGGRWYGKTKDGKFITVDEARKAGYKAAKRD
jgi:hypothetical protein